MADDKDTTRVLVPRDYSDIAKLQDPTALDDFLAQPATFIAETITGALAVGKTGVMVAGGRIVQALLKGRLFKQWQEEFRHLRDSGRIPDDFAEKKHGFHTWVELMTIIDEEAPDADRLEALKAMFYAVNKVSASDADRVQAYQLWRIAKGLQSGDLILLKTLAEQSNLLDGFNQPQWEQAVAERTGFGIVELVHVHADTLRETKLVWQMNSSHGPKSSLTALGRLLYKHIQSYELDLNAAFTAFK